MQTQSRRERIRAAQRARMAEINADTARAFNPQGAQLSGPSTQFRQEGLGPDDPNDKGGGLAGLGRLFVDALNPFSDFNSQIRRGGARGLIGAIDELGDFATTVGGGVAKITGAGEFFGGQDFLDWWEQDDDDRNPLHIGKDIISAPTSLIGSITEGVIQIGIGLLGVGKITKLGKLGSVFGKLGTIKRGLAEGAIADAIFFDAHDARMSNMVENGPSWLSNPITEYLAANPEDSEAEGRFKNALEGFMLGGTIAVLADGVKVWRAAAKGKFDEAINLAESFKEPPLPELIELPNGKFRLSRGAGDTTPLLSEVTEGSSKSAFLQGLDSADGLEPRLFKFNTPSGEAAVRAHLDGDVLFIESMGRFDSETGRIQIFDTSKNPVADVKGAERAQKLAEQDALAAGLTPEEAAMIGEEASRDAGHTFQIDPEFQNSVGTRKLMAVATELIAEFPDAKSIEGFHLKSGTQRGIPVTRFKKEIYASKGEAEQTILSMREGKRLRDLPLDDLSKESKASAEDLANAYKTNRTASTIRNAERQWIRANRTNMGTGREGLTKQITNLAKILSNTTGGSRKVMALLADDALQLVKGSQLEGILKVKEFSGLDVLALRRSAGLMLQSLGEDVSRYSIRLSQSSDDLAYLSMGRALDQMMHIEEILTGKPAVWFDRQKRLFGSGRERAGDPLGRHANLDAPESGSPNIDQPAPDAAAKQAEALEGKSPEKTVAPKPEEGLEAGSIGGEQQGADARAPESGRVEEPGPPQPGVSPGPKSLRNLSKTEIQRLGRFVALADGDPRAILVSAKASRLQAMAGASRGSIAETVVRWRLSAMLSAVGTQLVNTVSNTLQALVMPTELMIGGIIRREPQYLREGAHQMMGLVTELGDAWTAAGKAWRNKGGALDAAFMTREVDAGRFGGWLSVMNVPMDFLSTSDEFYKVLNYRARIRAKSLTSSAMAGLDAEAAAKRLIDDLESSISADGVGLNSDAIGYSRTATFTDPLVGKAKTIAGIFQGDDALGTAGKLFVPFIRTPHNIMKNIVLHSPLAMANLAAHQRAIVRGGGEAAAAMGRLAVASALTASAGLLVAAGRITGGGPRHPLTRKRWIEAGKEPYTIQAGGVKIHYNKLSSLFGPMAMVADIWQASGDIKSGNLTTEALATVVASQLNYVSDQSWIGNAADMMSVLFAGDPHAISNFVEKTVIGMAVPRAISQFAQIDDTMREANGFVENFMEQVPGLSSKLEPQRNIFREPVFKAPGSFDRIFNPFTSVGPSEDNQLALTLFRLGKQMALPPHLKYDGRLDLRDKDRFGEKDGMSAYEFWLEKTAHPGASSPSLKQALTRLINSPAWDNMPEGSEDWRGGPRYEAAARLIQTYQDLAEVQMFGAFPEVQRADLQEKMLRTFGRFGGRTATDALQESFSNPRQ